MSQRTRWSAGARRWARLGCLAGVALIVTCAPTWGADRVEVLPLGAQAPPFQLPGVDDRVHTLADYQAADVLVVVFTCNHCPTAQAYEDRIIRLYRDYHSRGVALVAISPNDPRAVRLDELGYTDLGDSLEEMKLRAAAKKFPFAYLYDGESQRVSRAYGVQATPHVYIFDRERKLRYVGRIDNDGKGKPMTREARDAIDSILAGKEVAVPKTRVFGCSTKWSSKRAAAREAVAKWDREPVELATADISTLHNLVTGQSEDYRLVKVWATWCGPCVSEMPEFVTMHRMYRRRNFQLLTICMDAPDRREAALKVLRDHHASMTNFIVNSTDPDALAEAIDPQWEGPVPYCLLVDPEGKVVYRHTGSIDPWEVKRTIADHLGRTYR